MVQPTKLLLLTIAVIANSVKSLPQFCEQATWSIAGFDVISSHSGYITLVAFMPLNCIKSETQLQKLQQLRQSDRELHILIVSPSDTFYDAGAEKRRKYPGLKFWVDSEFGSAWKQTGATEYDHFIYDRCGRLAEILQAPKSNISEYEDTSDAVMQVKKHARCGWCQYDPPNMKSGVIPPNRSPTNLVPTKQEQTNIVNKLRPPQQTSSDQRRLNQRQYQRQQQQQQQQRQHQQQQLHQHQQQDHQKQRQQQRGLQQNYTRTLRKHVSDRIKNTGGRTVDRSQFGNNSEKSQQTIQKKENISVRRQDPYLRRQHLRQGTRTQPSSSEKPQPNSQRYRQYLSHIKDFNKNQDSVESNNFRNEHQDPQRPGQNMNDFKPEQIIEDLTGNRKDSEDSDMEPSLYSVGGDEKTYNEKLTLGGRTLAPMQTQISAPVNHQIPLTTPYQSNEVVFCDHVTDERCYQEKKNQKDKTGWWKKCCSKGIYLTDVCVTGRCTNSTAQLCCAQKFLQARYRCCKNESQNAVQPTDSFSRCCYENFIDPQDVCCPLSTAKLYWSSTAELCLPNVFVNLTEVEFEAKISNTEQVVVKLAEDRSWEYKCTYGTAVIQFVYLPDIDEV